MALLLLGCSVHALPIDSKTKECAALSETDCAKTSGCKKRFSCPACDGSVSYEVCESSSEEDGACVEPKCGSCGAHLDKASCDADTQCASGTCPSCTGGEEFVACYDRGSARGFACPAGCPSTCDGLSEADCNANSSCALNGCGFCYDIGGVFQSCGNRNEGPKFQALTCDQCIDPCKNLDVASCTQNSNCQVWSGCGCSGPAACIDKRTPLPDCLGCACKVLGEACGASAECCSGVCVSVNSQGQCIAGD